MGNTLSKPVSGAQSIERALALLRHVAAAHAGGIGLSELHRAAGLDRTTVWRIVCALTQHGLLERDPAHGRYRLGMEAMALGMASLNRAPLVEACRPIMLTLARITGDNVFLVARAGDFSHCLHLEQGNHAIRSVVLNVGATRLLGLGVASVALLARLNDGALQAHFARHQSEYQDHDISLPKLRRGVAHTHTHGYSRASAGGFAGVGRWFQLGSCADAAMSIIAPRARLSRARAEELAALMARELARLLSEKMAVTLKQPVAVENRAGAAGIITIAAP
jgi:DNA-binding IclR family transcriptional regulator